VLLSDVFESIKLNLEGSTKEAVFAELIELITTLHPEYSKDELYTAINSRENKMSTGIGSGIAIPHGYCRNIKTITGAIGISKAGIDYDSLDREPVHLVFMLVMDEASREDHLRVLNKVFTLANSEVIAMIMAAASTREVHEVLSRVH
jgi:PTS system fructose-specific IIC component/PTS system nitrogen regulatory IIA component